MLLSVIENVWDFLVRLTSNGLSKDLLFYVSLGFVTLMVLFFMIKSRYAYEGRLLRILEKLNRWLYANQQIDDTNIVDFNNLVKKAPRLLRYHWQQYMLYREHEPSYYMSMYNCIEKPLHTSSYKANIKSYTWICCAAMAVSFLFSLIGYGKSSLTVEAIAVPLITPVIILVLSVLFVMLLRLMQNSTLSSLYQNFHLFNRYVDKASTTIPKFVDFEILFTRKEISGGIPVLNEYLERRARLEAEELEKARQNAIEHEVYSFESAGIDGSLILDRAMKESETYLNTRQRLLSQIQQFDSEVESLRRNYENTSKDYQRKLQASKENIERLRQQQEESTNRIEVNYIRKQQQDEIKKQEQLEKDQDSATIRYEDETAELQKQIDKCRAELDEKKNYAQSVMLSEYDTFATKIYKAILKDVEVKHQEEIEEIIAQKEDVQKELEQAQEINAIKDGVINDLKDWLHNSDSVGKLEVEEELPVTEIEEKEEPEEEVEQEPVKEEPVQEEPVKEEPVQEEPVKEESVQEEPEEKEEQPAEDGHYDENGYYWFNNGTYYDNFGYYHDENNDVYDADGNYISPEKYVELTGQKTEEEPVEEQEAEEVVQEEQPVEESVIQETEEQPEEKADEAQEETVEEQEMAEAEVPANEEIVEDEQPEEQISEEQEEPEAQEEVIEEQEEAQEESVEETVDETTDEDEEELEGSYDEEGYYRFNNGSYYDPMGYYHDTENNVYDSNGDYVEPERYEEIVKQNTENPVKVGEKRGRGRPRKEQPAEEVPAEEKRGRGRPKKVVEEQPEETPAEEKRGRGRPKKVVEEPEEVSVEEKRGRGRPKKVVEERPEDAPVEEKRGRGRPKKVVEEQPEDAPVEEKRGRGRPRKEETEAQDEPELQETQEDQEQQEDNRPQKYMVTYDKENKDWIIKKTGAARASKRCKTKKEALEIVDQLASNQDLNVSVKKKDGKFQKQKYESAADKPKGKRGRPRKNA